jgi:hypothetical protein
MKSTFTAKINFWKLMDDDPANIILLNPEIEG